MKAPIELRSLRDNSNRTSRIYVVGRSSQFRERVRERLENEGYLLTFFGDETAFMAELKRCVPACIVLVVDTTQCSNMELIERLRKNSCAAPVVVLSRLGVSTAVEAVRRGAFDFIEERNGDEEIVDQILRAVREFSRVQDTDVSKMLSKALRGSAPLTSREIDVLRQLLLGHTTKEAARHLGLSFRTVEDHRTRIMRKIGARNSIELVRKLIGY